MFLAQPAPSPRLQVGALGISIVQLHVTEPAASRALCVPQLILILSLGQTSVSACLPCSPSQSCPEGTSTPTPVQASNTWQIVIQVFSVIGSVIGILVAVFKVYPVIKARVAKLREAGIKPTLKRIVFLDKTLAKYRPLLDPGERDGSLQAVAQTVSPNSRTRRDGSGTNAPSASAIAHVPPALLSLTANQIGRLVRGRLARACMFPAVIRCFRLQA